MTVDLPSDAQAPDDVDALIATYLDARDRGQAPTKAAFLAANPDVAEDLGRFLDDLESFSPRPVLPSPDVWEDDTLTFNAVGSLPEAAAAAFQPGRSFGDYELIELVARGGMGVVFKARHAKLDRMVALKMILAGQLASPADIQRFRTEAQAAARLDHPGIVPVYEVGECQGLHYFTMAFVDGTSLAEKLRKGPLDPRESARLVRDLAAAIQFAHDNGVVHRDLKPGNVLIDQQGQPKLTDFGLAKRTDRASDVTGTGQILGTPSYMAPEQVGRDGETVGPAADVYGLGALLFALLTGRPPFQAATPLDTLLHVTSVDPPRPTALNPAVPRDLETICLKCLEKLPGRRYACAAALGEDLGRFLSDQPILARPVGVIERAYRWCRRRPVLGAMTVALAVLLAAVPLLLVGLLAQEVNAREKVQAAEQARARQLFDAKVNEAAARRSSPRVGHEFHALDRIAAAHDLADELKLPAEEFTRMRSEAIGALSLVDLKNTTTGPGWLVHRAMADCRYVAGTDLFLAWDKPDGLLVRRVSDHQIVHRIPVEPASWNSSSVRISPDNRFVSSQRADKLLIWQVDGAAPQERLRRAGVGFAAFAPDRPEIIIFNEAGELVLQPLAGAGEAKTVRLPEVIRDRQTRAYWRCQPGPGRRVAVQGADCVRIVDGEAGRIIATFAVPAVVQFMTWSPDGGTVAASCGLFGQIVSFDLARGIRRTFRGNVGGPEYLAYHPSGRFLLAVNLWNGRNTLFDVVTGGPALRFHFTELDADTSGRTEPSWWATSAETGHRVIPLLPEDEHGSAGECAIHPAGRLLATPTVRGIALHDLATGLRLGTVPAPKGCVHPRFDAAGNLFVSTARHPVRWPVTQEGHRIRIGPSEQMNLANGICIDTSSDGRFVVQAAYDKGSAVLDRQTGKITRLQPQTGVSLVAIHPDGSLVASFGWSVAEFRLWKTDTGKLVEIGRTEPNGCGRFTPDGKHLITVSQAPQLQLWSVPDCQLVRDLGPSGGFGISPDGRYVAVAEANGKVRITRISDGAMMARFDAPDEETINCVTFGPGGRYLVGLNTDRTRQHVWDLWQLRRRLAEMKLDWEADPPPETAESPEPITVEIATR